MGIRSKENKKIEKGGQIIVDSVGIDHSLGPHGREDDLSHSLGEMVVANRWPSSSHSSFTTGGLKMSPWGFVRDPVQLSYNQIALCVENYCMSYIISADSQKHLEPRVHRETSHAIFAQKIQDSIAFFRKREFDSGGNSLRSAFITLENLLQDPHPMNLALIMATLCDLERLDAKMMKKMLLKHLFEMAKTLRSQHPWISLFDALIQAPRDAIYTSLLHAGCEGETK